MLTMTAATDSQAGAAIWFWACRNLSSCCPSSCTAPLASTSLLGDNNPFWEAGMCW